MEANDPAKRTKPTGSATVNTSRRRELRGHPLPMGAREVPLTFSSAGSRTLTASRLKIDVTREVFPSRLPRQWNRRENVQWQKDNPRGRQTLHPGNKVLPLLGADSAGSKQQILAAQVD